MNKIQSTIIIFLLTTFIGLAQFSSDPSNPLVVSPIHSPQGALSSDVRIATNSSGYSYIA